MAWMQWEQGRTALERRRNHGVLAPGLLLLLGGVVAFQQVRPSFVPLPRATEASSSSENKEVDGLSRRNSMVAAVLAAGGAAQSASAQVIGGDRSTGISFMDETNIGRAATGNFDTGVAKTTVVLDSLQEPPSPPQGTKVRGISISTPSKDAFEKEATFWQKAAGMQALRQTPEKATFGYSNDFTIDITLNTSMANLPNPSIINYDVMQPTVDSLAFIQIGIQEKVMNVFKGVQKNGGESMFGDNLYLDALSPRGVPLRFVRRLEENEKSIEMVAFNLETPVFNPVQKFMKRTFGLREARYPEGDPGIGKNSIMLKSEAGGPTMLLSPIPDGRMKERWLDWYEGMKIEVKDPNNLEATAKQVSVDVIEEEVAAIENAKRKLKRLRDEGSDDPELREALKMKLNKKATRAKFEVFERSDGGKTVNVNGGVGDHIWISKGSDFVA